MFPVHCDTTCCVLSNKSYYKLNRWGRFTNTPRQTTVISHPTMSTWYQTNAHLNRWEENGY